MTGDVQIAVRPERQPGAVLIDLIARIARSKHVDEFASSAVVPQYGISPLTVDVQIAVRPEDQRGRFGQAAARCKHIDERSSSPVIPEDRICAIATDIHIPIWSDGEAARSRQSP